jgi:hypothetical protein
MNGLLVAARSRLPVWAGPAALAAFGATVVTFLAVVDPQTRAEWSPGCPFRSATGLDCPGCGATRAMYALVNGDVATAANHNVLLLAALPFLAWAYSRWTLVVLGRSSRLPNVGPRTAWTIATAVIVFAVARNVPLWPLSWLGSTPAG